MPWTVIQLCSNQQLQIAQRYYICRSSSGLIAIVVMVLFCRLLTRPGLVRQYQSGTIQSRLVLTLVCTITGPSGHKRPSHQPNTGSLSLTQPQWPFLLSVQMLLKVSWPRHFIDCPCVCLSTSLQLNLAVAGNKTSRSFEVMTCRVAGHRLRDRGYSPYTSTAFCTNLQTMCEWVAV